MNKREGKKLFKNISFKSKISQAREKFLEKLDLPGELIYEYSKITMIENKELLIEGYNNIVDYYDNYIKIQSKNIYIVIDGKKLDIREITDTDLLISGNIVSVNYMDR